MLSRVRIAWLIPTKNRHGSLPRTVRLLRRAARPSDEILLCDQTATPYPATAGITVLHRPDLNGLPAARNALLQATTAEVVCFLDDDTDLAPDFGAVLANLIATQPDVDGWGPVLEVRPRRIRRLHRLAQWGCFRDPRRLTGARIDAATSALFGAAFAVRTAVARQTGFDARRPGYALGEDLDFCWRAGGRFRFARKLRAWHRRDGADRADPARRAHGKVAFLVWLARRHGGGNPVTVLHLLLALAAAASGQGQERAKRTAVLGAAWRWWWT